MIINMAMLVTILQILAWILLSVVILVLGLITLLLFVPIRYRSSGEKQESVMTLYAIATFANPLVRAKILYESELIVEVRVLGIKIYSYTKKEDEEDLSDNASEYDSTIATSSVQKTVKQQGIEKEINIQEESIENRTQGEIEQEIVEQKKEDKIKSIIEKIKYFHDLLQEENETIRSFLKDCIYTLKKIAPYKCKMNISYGTGEADTTGYLYGFYNMMLPFLSKDVVLEPIWLEKTLEGEYTLKGRIRLVHIVILAVKLMIKKEYHTVYTKIKGGLTYGRSSSE
ncbi:MAG: hypothetical protein R3Y47_05540 [Lachnospiraceae bacterium]